MRIGIIANPELKGLSSFIRRALTALEGHDIFLESSIAKKHPQIAIEIGEMDVDKVITIGGDGTVLYTLQKLKKSTPILSVRAGLLGFLTEIDKSDLEEGIERLLSGEYFVEERMRISSKIDGTNLPDALNEVVIHTSQVGKLRHFNVKIDGKLATTMKADGLIMATPTGSTSYSLSVGAPIIDPRLEAFVIAPIAPLWNAAKPLVIPASSEIQITLEQPRRCSVVSDGRDEMPFEGGERVEVFKSNTPAQFVRFDLDFYRRLRQKLQRMVGTDSIAY